MKAAYNVLYIHLIMTVKSKRKLSCDKHGGRPENYIKIYFKDLMVGLTEKYGSGF